MPKQSTIKKNVKTEVTQQDTFRYFTGVDPAARPVEVETRVRPKNTSGGNTAAFLTMLDTMKEGMRGLAGIAKIKNQESMEEGSMAAAKGEDLPQDANRYFIKGYEKMKGMGQGVLELQRVLQGHYNEHYTDDPVTFHKSQEKAINEYMGGRTDNFIEGLLPGAMELQSHFQNEFHKQKQAEFKLDKLTTTRNLLDAQLQKIYIDESVTDKPKAVRQLLSDVQTIGINGLKLNRTEVSTQLVSLLTEKAISTGDQSYLDAAFEPDASGVRLIDNPEFASNIMDARRQSESVRISRENAARQEMERAEKQVRETVTGAMAQYLNVVGDATVKKEDREKALVELNNILYKFSDKKRNNLGVQLTDEEIRLYQKEIAELSGGGAGVFATQSNMDMYDLAYSTARLNPHELTQKALDGLKPYLTRSDYEEILKAKASSMDEQKNSGNKKSVELNRYENNVSNVMREVNKVNKFGVDLFDNGAKRRSIAERLSFIYWDDFKAKNNREPNQFEQYDIIKRIKDDVNAIEPPVFAEFVSDDEKKVISSQMNRPANSIPTTDPTKTATITSGFDNLKKKKNSESPKETLDRQGN